MPVVLLMHCDGTNGSTTFTDTSPSAHSLTAVSGAQVTTSAAKFGTGSARFNTNTAAGIDTNNLTDFQFGAGQFTAEAWAYFTSAPGANYNAICGLWGNDPLSSWWFGTDNSSHLTLLWTTTGSYNAGTLLQAAFSPTLNTWYHLAVDRDASNVIRLYINGAVAASVSGAATLYPASTLTCTVGQDYTGNADAFLGYLDEVRITKGLAQYGGAFTPASAPFPDGAVATQARVMVMA